ncbi:co-chaperone DjlA [Aestuariibacter sp. AA17]|uniref:Co-chaperone protein DjlA n=1 Tax=Fluctibacter corallii TaxID=2984329 RepID=A0ABT3A5B8_9ALTE|nr:co-chaperone DjlA [Aestuariibacter sp. AA17]MCV2883561.1 co-chaperone DjlA [Aestuariibacter sp. AA17]
MPIWGKVLGTLFGFMFGRIPGAILGFIVGHMFDRGYSQDFSQQGGFSRFFTSQDQIKSQAVFFHALFSVMGHIAKADGQVKSEEIRVATALMDEMGLEGDVRKEAQQAFREGKERDFPLLKTLKSFSESCHGRRDIKQVFLEILIQSAYADGSVDAAEQRVLENVAEGLGFKQNELLYLMSMFEAEVRFRQHTRYQSQTGQSQHQYRQRTHQSAPKGPTLQDAYKILGVNKSDDDRAIKKAYRKLMSEHHPDKLVSKGLPKQAMEIAKNKAQDIQAAYEMIKQERGMK